MNQAIPLYNRASREIEYEQVFEQGFMGFVYGTPQGRLLEKTIISRPTISVIYGVLQRLPLSRRKIVPFVEKYNVDVTELKEDISRFACFNDFFKRRLRDGARPIAQDPEVLISPCDARLLCYPIKDGTVIPLKGSVFSVAALLKNGGLAAQYNGGTCLVFRLAPVDYHRFCYIDHGYQSPVKTINGLLHSVSPLSLERLVAPFTENYREYTILSTHSFGDVVHVDIGALVVGKIVQHQRERCDFVRGHEKGLFEFGGSTIVLIFKADCLDMDSDIRRQSLVGIESLVRMGEPIGMVRRAISIA